MSNDQFNDLPDPSDKQIERAADDASADTTSTDDVADPTEFPDEEEIELIEEAAGDLRTTESEVTEEDLSSADLIDDGALPEDLEQDNVGVREVEADLEDPARQDTIDARVRQEEPEPGFDVVPEPGGSGDVGDEIGLADLP